jgi:TonB family protein
MIMKKFLFVPVFMSLFACGNGQQAGASTEESNAVESVPKLAEMKLASIEYMAKLDTAPTIKGIKEEEVSKVKMNIAGALMFNGFITNIGNAVNLLHEANPTYIVLEIDKKTPKDSVDLLVDGIYAYYKENVSDESPKYFFFKQSDYYDENSGERRYEDLSGEFFYPYNPAPPQAAPQVVGMTQAPDSYPADYPRFPGGDEAYLRWIKENINYPKECKELGIQGRVIAKIIVKADGKITDIEITRSPDERLSAEAIRLIKAMPDWIPVHKDGKAVESTCYLPIRFIL